VTVRPVRRADLDQVIAIDATVTGIEKRSYWQRVYRRYGVSARGEQRWFLVALAGDRVAGFLIGEVRDWEFGSPPCGWLFTIGVRPDYRLAKTGTELFDALVARFRERGVATCRTMLHIDDHLLMSFFRAQGLTAGPFIELEKRLVDEQDA
jgi:ribosomal protein S18 acetylase RimI-like enzyme